MATSGASTRQVATTANAEADQSFSLRIKLVPPSALISGMGPHRHSARDAPHHQPRQSIDHQGHQKQDQADLDERAQVQVASSLAEFISNDAGQGVAGRKQ